MTIQSILTLLRNQILTKKEQVQFELLSSFAENLHTIANLKKEDPWIESYSYQFNVYQEMLTLEKEYGSVLLESKVNRLIVLKEKILKNHSMKPNQLFFRFIFLTEFSFFL